MRITVSLHPELPDKAPADEVLYSESSPGSVSSKSSPRASVLDKSSPVSGKGGQGKGYLLLEIADTGIGISEEKRKSLFLPFKQAQRFAGGTGLGLFSLARRVEAQKGAFGVRDREDGVQGCIFWFMLPYKPDPTMIPHTEGVVKSSSFNALLALEASPPTVSFAPTEPVPSEVSLTDHTTNTATTSEETSPRALSATSTTTINGATTAAVANTLSLDVLLVDDSISGMGLLNFHNKSYILHD